MAKEYSVSELLLRWQGLRDQGQIISAEELCAGCPELLDDLRRQIQALLSMEQFLGTAPGECLEPVTERHSQAAAPAPDSVQETVCNGPGTSVAVGPGWDGAGPRYRLLHIHAKGGLGEVFVAQDSELNREVALKRIKEEYRGQADSRRSFLREAEITAKLEHPGVVPVHGLVRDADGQPCYAMRFIRGETLSDAIKQFHEADNKLGRDPSERSLALRQLLNRFVAVCNTIAYAHSRGVLHRDLKPSNIMLGKYGETLVVDWGLAKPFTRTEAERAAGEETLRSTADAGADGSTRLGDVKGTPAFMSPEQAGGRLHELCPASDIFSLGATLYAILAGQAPQQGRTKWEVLDKARRGEFVPPRQIKPGVPRALEAICLKAMSLKPQDRYATALELRADVDKWLADEPVSAYREPLRARTRRVLLRHKSLVTGSAVLVLTTLLLVGGWLGWWLWQRASVRRAVQDDLAQVEAVLGDPGRNPAEARPALERAEGRLSGVAPASLRQQVQDWRNALELIDRLEKARQQAALVSKGELDHAGADRLYTEAFADYSLDVEVLAPEEAAACVRASPLRERLIAALDDWAFTRENAQVRLNAGESILAVARLADDDTWRQQLRDPTVRRDGERLARLAEGEEVQTQPPSRLVQLGLLLQFAKQWTAAERLLREAQQRYPADFWANFALAHLFEAKKPPNLEDAVGFYRAAFALRPDSPAALNNLGLALKAKGDLEGAIRCWRAALEIDPNHAKVHANLGHASEVRGDLEGAIRHYRAALALDPKDALSHNNLGNVLKAHGDLEGAIRCFRTSLEINPKLVLPHNNLGIALDAKGDLEGAIRCYHRAIKLEPKYVQAHNNLGAALNAKGDREGAICCWRVALKLDPKCAAASSNLGSALQAKGDLEGAIRCFRTALDLDPKLAAVHYNLGVALSAKQDLKGAIDCFRTALRLDPKYAAAHNNLGAALYAQGDLEGAIRSWRSAIKLEPRNAVAHNNVGAALNGKGDLEGAIRYYRQAIEIDPKNALAHNNLGVALKAKGDFEGAIRCYRQAIETDPGYALAHDNLGRALRETGDLDGAIDCWRTAIKLDPKLAQAHHDLGTGLNAKADLEGAIRCYRQALEIDPKLADAHYNLGVALYAKHDLEGAADCYRTALKLNRKDAQAHGSLGQVLLAQGRFAEARAATQKSLQLLHPNQALYAAASRQLHACETLLALDAKLPAVLKGKAKPAGVDEQLGLAKLCRVYKKLYAASARFYAGAFVAESKRAHDLGTQNRYNAACASALAGCGKGEDAAKLNDEERARLRKQALDWLRDDLTAWRKLLDKDPNTDRTVVAKTMQHWQNDMDLSAVRGAALTQLPERECGEWRRLWDDVEALIQRAAPQPELVPPPKEEPP
jgi:tetratricopeptide (TPR) repeat protein/serine/threonine protein kinase